MTVIDDIIDVPVPEWCPAIDAHLWIMLKRPPVSYRHVSISNDGSLYLGFDNDGPVNLKPNYLSSWDKLYEAGRAGVVEFRGKPAIELRRVSFNSPSLWKNFGQPPSCSEAGGCKVTATYVPGESLGCPDIRCQEWGDIEVVPTEKLKQVERGAFFTFANWGFLSDKINFDPEHCPPTAWAYYQLEVNVPQLIKLFHSTEGKDLRIGNEVIFIQSEELQEQPTDKVAAERNLGGRPPKWEWEAAINAIWAEIYHGRLTPKVRLDCTRYMRKWFSERHEGLRPSDDSIRERIAAMWVALQ